MDLIDDDCATALGADSVAQAREKLQGIKITYNDLGQVKFETKNGNIVLAEGSGDFAQYNPVIGFRGINLNTHVNWSDPNNISALLDGKPYTYRALDAQAASLGVGSLTANQFMDLNILHELSHSLGGDHKKSAEADFDKRIWDKCLQP